MFCRGVARQARPIKSVLSERQYWPVAKPSDWFRHRLTNLFDMAPNPAASKSRRATCWCSPGCRSERGLLLEARPGPGGKYSSRDDHDTAGSAHAPIPCGDGGLWTTGPLPSPAWAKSQSRADPCLARGDMHWSAAVTQVGRSPDAKTYHHLYRRLVRLAFLAPTQAPSSRGTNRWIFALHGLMDHVPPTFGRNNVRLLAGQPPPSNAGNAALFTSCAFCYPAYFACFSRHLPTCYLA